MDKGILDTIEIFKGKNLRNQIALYSQQCKNDCVDEAIINSKLFSSALAIKQVATQVNEIVHAVGILLLWKKIRVEGETISRLCLASSSDNGFTYDLLTNIRVAEFKFGKWQPGSANGWRKRQLFKGLILLMMCEENVQKELYVQSKNIVEKFLTGKADWRKILNKSGPGIQKSFENWLIENNLTHLSTINDVYSHSRVHLLEISNILEIENF